MVGVPGRSKACTTCRRRRIRCDLGEPDCQRCIKSGRSCEGYRRYPTFLISTQKGPQKRYGLEEAKPREPKGAALAAPQTSPQRLPTPVVSLLLQIDNAKAHDCQILSHFWGIWVPANATAKDEYPCAWLEMSMAIQEPGRALRLSLKSLAMTRLGHIDDDIALGTSGRNCYGNALRELQKALWDEKLMWHEETLAAAYILSVYELFETTTNSIRGWNSHISGMGYLVQMRGPKRHRSPLARAVLEAYSDSSMIQSIQYRRAHFLGNQDWRAQPWGRISHKGDLQRLYDYGFILGNLTEAVDNAGLRNGEISQQACLSYLHRFSRIDAMLDAWYQEFLDTSPTPLCWLDISHCGRQRPQEGSMPNDRIPFTFPRLSVANAFIKYWALKIISSVSIATLCDAHNGSGLSNSRSTESVVLEPGSSVGTFANKYNNLHRVELATNIVRAMPYFLDSAVGLFGAQRSLFSLRAALYVLLQYPGEDLERCKMLYHQLTNRKGLGYAREIAKLDVGYSRNGSPAASPGITANDLPYRVQPIDQLSDGSSDFLFPDED